MGIPTVERAVIQEDTKTKTYKLLVEGTGLQVSCKGGYIG